jgi:hypothetical protein
MVKWPNGDLIRSQWIGFSKVVFVASSDNCSVSLTPIRCATSCPLATLEIRESR